MSAQPSLLISTRLLSSEIVEAEASALDTQIINLSESIAPLIPGTPATEQSILPPNATEALAESSAQAKQALKQIEEKLASDETAAEEDIETLQQRMLNDPDFDFSSLPSTAAGPDSNTGAASGDNSELSGGIQESFASNAYIESTSTSTASTLGQAQTSSLAELKTPAQQDTSNNTDNTITSESDENLSTKSIGSSHHSATEDIRYEVEGKINSPYEFTSATQVTEYGQISYQEDGSWTYSLDNFSDQIQALGANETLVESINLVSKSGNTFTLNFTIHGTNDTARIFGDDSGEVTALSNHDPAQRPETTQGNLTIFDTDDNQSNMLAQEDIQGTYGSLTIDDNGAWTYSLNSESEAVRSLHEGDSLHDLIPVSALDGTNQLLKITIHGADDSPYLGGTNAQEIDLETSSSAEQKLDIDDPDFGQSHFVAEEEISTIFNYGTGSIDEHGNWRYEVNTDHPSIISLGENENPLRDAFTVETVDGTTQTVIVTINGSDQPLFAQTEPLENELLDTSNLITQAETDDIQETLDSFLQDTDPESQMIGANGDSATNNHNLGNSSAEILQQLSNQNNHDTQSFG